MSVKTVNGYLPGKNAAYGASAFNFPASHMPTVRNYMIAAYMPNKKEIDSGQHMDVVFANVGTVSFRFTPSLDYPECGISGGTFIAFKEKA